ncbi:hypothetical protein F5Y03DRAFT_399366 [Xylaria venustula]|nr:hypothetical protein F5Y03DRAFT_399366 [Xylaria venustula]
MDSYIHTVSWGQAWVGNEPIYCDGPSPLNSDDIICPGSDNETDEIAKVARQRRYEEHGRRYLQGRPLRILSASLHGPFDRVSGWQNPWLPNLSSRKTEPLEDPSQPPTASSVAQYETGIPDDGLSSGGNGTIRDMDDSLECHLPSPQSHQDLQLFVSPSRLERRCRIESWAENVRGGFLEKEKFWAPDNDSVDHDAEPTQKRPAGRNWLKRRPMKKRKLPASQATEATSTLTPTPTTQSRAKRSKIPKDGRKLINRSFEMTTPSSSPDRGPKESPNTVELEPVALCGEYEHSVASNTERRDIQRPTEPNVRSGQDEEEREQEGHHDRENEHEAGNAEVFEDRDRCQSQRQTSHGHDIEETEEISGFETRADDSFCYRARFSRAAVPPLTCNATVADCPPQDTKAEAFVPPRYSDAITFSSNSGTQESKISERCEHSIASDVEHMNTANENPGSITINNEPNYTMVAEPHMGMHQKCDIKSASEHTTSTSRINRGQPLGDLTSKEQAARLNIRDNIPQTVLEVKATRCVSPETSIDEDITLVGDQMDMGGLGNTIFAPQSPAHLSSEALSVLQLYAISATNMANASQQTQSYGITSPDKMTNTGSYTMATIPRQDTVDLQWPVNNQPISQDSRLSLMNSVVVAEPISNQNDQDEPQIMTETQITPPERQSPWAPLGTVKEDLRSSNDSTKRGGDEIREMPAQPILTLLATPKLIDDSPAIRPSQQSPWAEDTVKLTNRTGLQGTVEIDTAVIVNTETPKTLSNPLLPEYQQHMETVSSSAIPPMSSKSWQMPCGTHDLEDSNLAKGEAGLITEGFPSTPVPPIARQSTPVGEVSIRSFSNFNGSSPHQSLCPSSSSACRSILSSSKRLRTGMSTRSIKRVLFAPLPHEQDDDSNSFSAKPRPASPPPLTPVDLEEEIVDGKYRNHFAMMNRRLSVHGTSTLRYHRRLLPSSSQQKPESPSVEAMANAFREADVRQLDYSDNMVLSSKADEKEGRFEQVEEKPQSPWRHDAEDIDDVSAVMGNLNQFLDVWDMDAEIDRNRTELDETETHGAPSNSDVGILLGADIW